MRTLVFIGLGLVELCDVPEPDPGPGEVLVQVHAAGICGSELHGALHPGFRKPLLIMGHEFAGTTAEGMRWWSTRSFPAASAACASAGCATSAGNGRSSACTAPAGSPSASRSPRQRSACCRRGCHGRPRR